MSTQEIREVRKRLDQCKTPYQELIISRDLSIDHLEKDFHVREMKSNVSALLATPLDSASRKGLEDAFAHLDKFRGATQNEDRFKEWCASWDTISIPEVKAAWKGSELPSDRERKELDKATKKRNGTVKNINKNIKKISSLDPAKLSTDLGRIKKSNEEIIKRNEIRRTLNIDKPTDRQKKMLDTDPKKITYGRIINTQARQGFQRWWNKSKTEKAMGAGKTLAFGVVGGVLKSVATAGKDLVYTLPKSIVRSPIEAYNLIRNKGPYEYNPPLSKKEKLAVAGKGLLNFTKSVGNVAWTLGAVGAMVVVPGAPLVAAGIAAVGTAAYLSSTGALAAVNAGEGLAYHHASNKLKKELGEKMEVCREHMKKVGPQMKELQSNSVAVNELAKILKAEKAVIEEKLSKGEKPDLDRLDNLEKVIQRRRESLKECKEKLLKTVEEITPEQLETLKKGMEQIRDQQRMAGRMVRGYEGAARETVEFFNWAVTIGAIGKVAAGNLDGAANQILFGENVSGQLDFSSLPGAFGPAPDGGGAVSFDVAQGLDNSAEYPLFAAQDMVLGGMGKTEDSGQSTTARFRGVRREGVQQKWQLAASKDMNQEFNSALASAVFDQGDNLAKELSEVKEKAAEAVAKAAEIDAAAAFISSSEALVAETMRREVAQDRERLEAAALAANEETAGQDVAGAGREHSEMDEREQADKASLKARAALVDVAIDDEEAERVGVGGPKRPSVGELMGRPKTGKPVGAAAKEVSRAEPDPSQLSVKDKIKMFGRDHGENGQSVKQGKGKGVG